MRIVAGRLGGRRLKAPPGPRTRPTSDRVREALFSILGPVEGARTLDLYAGSGALGIEALSRGAAEAVFVDRDRRAVAAIEANLEALEIEAPVLCADAADYLAGRRAAAVPGPFELVFADPPYSSAAAAAGALSALLPAVLSEDARIVTESDNRAPLELDLPLVTARRYGDTRIAVHRAS
ncbi:MAG: 16S rRNA (guanine(966)-N(2))-methyltransferase RsmD [Thermoleophilaceae bacterium]